MLLFLIGMWTMNYADIDTLALATSVRLRRIVRLPNGWRLWIDTADFVYGTYYELHDTGRVVRFTVREDQGDEIVQMRPSTAEICREIV